jgi:Carboxypeptidase regulatory-like domain
VARSTLIKMQWTIRWLIGIAWVHSMLVGADLHGKVVDGTSGDPISSVVVQLSMNGELVSEVSTDSGGRFHFGSIAIGRYKINAIKRDYVDLLPDIEASKDVRTTEPSTSATLSLIRASAITGRVFNSSGLPVPDQRVVALIRRSGKGGPRLFRDGHSALTDDRGVYRIYGLTPGSYTIAVVPEGAQWDAPAFAPLYFPGARDSAQSQFFAVRSGETRAGADLSLISVAGYEVQGKVIGVPEEWNGAKPAVSILSMSGVGWQMQTVTADTEGKFCFRGIPSGSYRIFAWGPVIAWGQKGPVAGPTMQQGSLMVEVNGSPVDNIRLQLSEAAVLTGHLVFDTEDGTSECYSGAEVVLRSVEPLPELLLHTGELESKGTFRIRNVPDGRYRIDLKGLHGPCFLKEVRLKRQYASDRQIEIQGNSSVELILSSQVGKISGTVSALGEQVAKRFVIAIPTSLGPGEFADFIGITSTDEKGRFALNGLIPGGYRIIAVSKIDSTDYLDSEFWEQHRAIEISVEPGESKNVELKVVI